MRGRAQHRADEFVDGVVAANIFAYEQMLAIDETCRMHAAAARIQGLPLRQSRKAVVDAMRAELRAGAHLPCRAHGGLQARRAAQPAAAAAFEAALALFDGIEAALRDRGVQGDAIVAADDVDQREFFCRRDDAFANREAQREILQIRGRGHHHREREIVVEQGDRNFLDYPFFAQTAVVAADV